MSTSRKQSTHCEGQARGCALQQKPSQEGNFRKNNTGSSDPTLILLVQVLRFRKWITCREKSYFWQWALNSGR
jgi:hypothetical protein